MTLNNSQYVLPFDQAKNDLLAQIRFLRGCDLGLSPGRSEGVIQLLERLALLGNDLSERDGAVYVKAQIIAIAARVEARRTVADRTVRNWRVDAESLGILSTDHRSHKWGRCEWNLFRIDVARIREIVASKGVANPVANPVANEGGNGRKWAETVAAPGAEMIAAPRAETVAAPNIEVFNEETNNNQQTPVVVVSLDLKRESKESTDCETRVVDALEACGVGRPEEAFKRALARGLTVADCETRVADWHKLPESQRRPGTLFNWFAVRGSYEATLKAREVETRPRASKVAEQANRIAESERARQAARASGGMSAEEKAILRAAGLAVK
jgi:hypothetical protein